MSGSKTLVIYFTLTGHSRDIARTEAITRDAPILEIASRRRRPLLHSLVIGTIGAIRQSAPPITGELPDLGRYDHFVIVAPVWLGGPAPAFYAILDMLPPHSSVDILLDSDSGDTHLTRARTISYAENRGIQVNSYSDIRTEGLFRRVSGWAAAFA